MAATGYTPISLYYSTTAAAQPTAGNLVNGELAINITDGKLYYKDNGGVVQLLASKGGTPPGGATTQVQYNNAGAFAGSANMTFNGTSLTLANVLNAPSVNGATTLTLATGGTTAVNVLANQNVGVGVSPVVKLQVDGTFGISSGGTYTGSVFTNSSALDVQAGSNATNGLRLGTTTLSPIIFYQNGSATGQMRLDTSSRLLIGLTSAIDSNLLQVNSGAVFVGTGYSPNINLTDAATIAWDTSLGQVATFTFVSSNRTMGAPTNLVNGGFYALAVIQNGGGNTLTWNSVFKWAGGVAPSLSTSAGAKDYFVFRSDGTNLYQQGASLGVA